VRSVPSKFVRGRAKEWLGPPALVPCEALLRGIGETHGIRFAFPFRAEFAKHYAAAMAAPSPWRIGSRFFQRRMTVELVPALPVYQSPGLRWASLVPVPSHARYSAAREARGSLPIGRKFSNPKPHRF